MSLSILSNIIMPFSDTCFVLATLLLSITCFFIIQKSLLRTWGAYLAGICHGFVAVLVLLLTLSVTFIEIQHVPTSTQGSEAFICVTANSSFVCSKKNQGDVTLIGMDTWLAFLVSYTICLILCNAVVNCKLDVVSKVLPQGIK